MNNPVDENNARRIGAFRNVLYRAWPTKRDYSFTFEFTGHHWLVYINNSPDYRGRPSGTLDSHRLGLGSRPYICWVPDPTTLSMAQSVAAIWADATENYILTGSFEPAPGRPKVTDRSVLNGFPGARPAAREPIPPADRRPATPTPRPSFWARVRNELSF